MLPSYKYLCHLENKNDFLYQISLSHVGLNEVERFLHYRISLKRTFHMPIYCGIQEQKVCMTFLVLDHQPLCYEFLCDHQSIATMKLTFIMDITCKYKCSYPKLNYKK